MNTTTLHAPELDLLPGFCHLVILESSAPVFCALWRAERKRAKRILRRAETPGYFDGEQATIDFAWTQEMLMVVETRLRDRFQPWRDAR